MIFYKDAKGTDIFQLKIPDMNEDDVRHFQEKLKTLLPLKGRAPEPEQKNGENKTQEEEQTDHNQVVIN